MPIEDTKLQILNDHYKDTFLYIREYIKLRDKLLIFILLTIAVMLLQIHSPKEFSDAISKFIAEKIESSSFTDLSFIGTLNWFLLLGLSLRYFQTTVLIDRQYEYIHQVEEYIRNNYTIDVFAREGRHYLHDYPLLSDFAHILYVKIFPFLLLLVGIIKILRELPNLRSNVEMTVINFVIFIIFAALILLYLIPSLLRRT